MAEVIDMLCGFTRAKKRKEMTLNRIVSRFSILSRYFGTRRSLGQHLQVQLTKNISHSHYQFRTILDQRKRTNARTTIDTAWNCKWFTLAIHLAGLALGITQNYSGLWPI
jgi:hypothetical protein